jgi:transposase
LRQPAAQAAPSYNALLADNRQLSERLERAESALLLYKEKQKQSAQAYDNLLQALKQMQRRVFGPRSERFIDQNPSQGDFFSSINPKALESALENEETEDSTCASPKQKKKKRSKKNLDFAKNLPRREVIIPAEDQQDTDKFMRYETSELMNYIPAVYEIILQKREVWVRMLSDSSVATIVTAPNPVRFLPKAKVTESFLAHLIVGKLYDRQPLYHLEKKCKERFDFICERNKLARWFIQSAKGLQPIVNLLRDEVLDYDIAGCDPTHIQVLNEAGRRPELKSYFYSIRGGPPEKSVRVYEYHAEHHKRFLEDWFAGYEGYLHVDGQNIFDVFEESSAINLVLCHSHARRKFEPIAKAAHQKGLASQVMSYYHQLYKIERRAKEAQLDAEQRDTLRQKETKPLLDELFTWMKQVGPTTLKQSPLGKAFEYVLKREVGLRRCLEDGRLELDTNLLEQQNKDFALARNNFMFSHSVEGAHALGVHMSLVFTAIAHGLDPYHYYVHIMQRVPHCKTVEDYEYLLPWHVDLKKKNAEGNKKAA